jgi:catechol 2,3-dioxygenase-like lactoylglutathione lyase family enzyme
MDHVTLVVEDMPAAIAFFLELGLELEGEMSVEGDWVDRIAGLEDVRAEIAMVRTPDGHGKLELTHYRNPPATTAEPGAPPNTLGFRQVMFEVEGLDGLVERLARRGHELIGEIVEYEAYYRLCYVRGPEGVIVALAESLQRD